MRTLQFCQTLKFSENISERVNEVRRYSRVATILFACFTLLVILKVKNSTLDLFQPIENAKPREEKAQNIANKLMGAHNMTASVVVGELNSSSKSTNTSSKPVNHDHKLIDELLASAFDEESCLSRYHSFSYRKNQPYNPSPYLISKLRRYEELHARCGPHSSAYRRIIRKLTRVGHFNETTPCKYLVWTPVNGLGNRMVSMASAFLYALLENRILLVEFEADMHGLFCEPFPNSSWILPKNFPHKNHWSSLPSFKSSRGVSGNDVSPPFVHLDLQHGHGDSTLRCFHCNDTQSLLAKIPVLILLSDQYFAPSLFVATFFKEELNRMFLEKASVFHLLGYYLFLPSNEAWGLITRFYQAYLANADEKIGLQIRVFTSQKPPYQSIMAQVLACTLDYKVLPSLDKEKTLNFPSQNLSSKSKAVLVASLYPQFSEELRSMYWTRPTVTGDVIGVYQPSHEEYQKFGDNMHFMKAWVEIYLLSLSDVLVTSGQSTFGYVAQGLGGLKPWILRRLGSKEAKVPNPPCERAMSVEPCLHVPPEYDCKGKTKIGNISALYPHLLACEDLWWGVKLVDA